MVTYSVPGIAYKSVLRYFDIVALNSAKLFGIEIPFKVKSYLIIDGQHEYVCALLAVDLMLSLKFKLHG
jgi:hypothetical protein